MTLKEKLVIETKIQPQVVKAKAKAEAETEIVESMSETLIVKLPNAPSHDPDKDDSFADVGAATVAPSTAAAASSYTTAAAATTDVKSPKDKKSKNGFTRVLTKLKNKVSFSPASASQS